MSCDIHMHVEYKIEFFDKINHIKKWMCGDYFKINPYYGLNEHEKKFEPVGFCDERNYSLFAILADVRNYENTKYIDEPRGLPIDVTEQVKMDSEEFGVDGHSHSYFSLRELIEFQNKALVPLIEALKQRAKELYVIHDFLWEQNPEEALKKADNIRIVFWFDN